MYASSVETYLKEIYWKKCIELGIVQTSVFNAPWLRQIVYNKSMLSRLQVNRPVFRDLSLQFRSVSMIYTLYFYIKILLHVNFISM